MRIKDRVQGFLDILNNVLSMPLLTHHFLVWAEVRDTHESAFIGQGNICTTAPCSSQLCWRPQTSAVTPVPPSQEPAPRRSHGVPESFLRKQMHPVRSAAPDPCCTVIHSGPSQTPPSPWDGLIQAGHIGLGKKEWNQRQPLWAGPGTLAWPRYWDSGM